MTWLHLYVVFLVNIATAETGFFIFGGHNFFIAFIATITYVGAFFSLGDCGTTREERERRDAWRHQIPPM